MSRNNKQFNNDKRCLHCNGTLISTTGFAPAIIFPIKNDVMKVIEHNYDENGKDVFYDIKEIKINFCPFCGCQLRKEVDLSLCD